MTTRVAQLRVTPRIGHIISSHKEPWITSLARRRRSLLRVFAVTLSAPSTAVSPRFPPPPPWSLVSPPPHHGLLTGGSSPRPPTLFCPPPVGGGGRRWPPIRVDGAPRRRRRCAGCAHAPVPLPCVFLLRVPRRGRYHRLAHPACWCVYPLAARPDGGRGGLPRQRRRRGAPPVDARGAPPVGTRGAPPVDARGAPPVDARGGSCTGGTGSGPAGAHAPPPRGGRGGR